MNSPNYLNRLSTFRRELHLRRRIAEGETIKAEDVAILYVEKQDGESSVRQLNLDDGGHFGDWSEGFFDETFADVMHLAMAQTKKRPAK